MSNLMSTNGYDIAILVILFISILIGLKRGFFSEILSLIILIAAFAIAVLFSSSLAGYISGLPFMQGMVSGSSSDSSPTIYMVLAMSFAILFIGSWIIGGIIKIIMNMMMVREILGFGNRLLGAVFGLLRGYLFCLVLIFLVQLSPMSANASWKESKYVPLFKTQVEWLGGIVSPKLADLKTRLDAAVKEVDGKAKDASTSTVNKVDKK